MDATSARGLVVHRYGDWRDIAVEPIEVAPPGPGEVLIEAEAAALNFPDALMIAGKYQHKPVPPFCPGRDVAGRVAAIGPEVEGLAVGDRVAGQPQHGAFATRVLVPQNACIRIPDGLSTIDAAASGTVLATAVAALGMRARLQPGEFVLLTGAAGGVGLAAVQYAKLMGARVGAIVSSAEKENAARASGADVVIRTDAMTNLRDDLRQAVHAHSPKGADAVMDVVGGDLFDAVIRCLRPGGRCVVVGFASGRIPTISTNYLLLKDLVLIGSSLTTLFRSGNAEFRTKLEDGFRALAEGRITIPIEHCYRMEEFGTAMARIVDRKAIGKIVLAPLQ